jgi:nicotinamidase-related amidase
MTAARHAWMPETLLVVDVQHGFINPYTRHVPRRVLRLADAQPFREVLFTLFLNPPGSHYRKLLQWDACSGPPDTELVPELEQLATPGRVFRKYGMAGLPDDLKQYLREHAIERLAIVGIDTDMCVLKCAMDAFDLGVEPVVLIDCCASTAGLQAHLAGLSILSRNIGPLQLRLSDQSGTYLAAPRGD